MFTKVLPPLVTPVQRTTFQVVCQAEGFPRPVINWSRVGMSLPGGRTEVNQGTLTIKNLSPADSGLYDCVATNIMGTKKARINVAVQRKPGLLYLFGLGWWQTPLSANGHFRLPRGEFLAAIGKTDIIQSNLYANLTITNKRSLIPRSP